VSGDGRRLYLDLSPGEARGVVTLDGQPERLLIDRGAEPAVQAQGAVAVGRVRRIERGLATAFIDLGDGPDAVLALGGPAAALAEGQAVELEIAAPARRGKGAVARFRGAADGRPRVLTPAPGLTERLRSFAPGAPGPVGGEDARDMADLAEEQALAVEHPLGGGASLAIEPTRALVSIDVDVGGAAGGDRRRGEGQVNRRALAAAARLLRLKGLGGLVVFDLAGRGQDGEALMQAARAAFAPDMPDVVFGPVSRFGTFQLVLPWRSRPLAETLADPDGRPSAQTVAGRLARAVEREAARAVRIKARCAPEVAAAFEALRPALVARLGPRFDILSEPGLDRAAFEIRTDD
jgi:Ribonuclease G/E